MLFSLQEKRGGQVVPTPTLFLVLLLSGGGCFGISHVFKSFFARLFERNLLI
jgi:hypothetical protein